LLLTHTMALTRSLSLSYAAVFDDVVNQLHVLGKVMPAQLEGLPEAESVVNREIKNVIKNQHTTEAKLEAVLSMRAAEIKEKILIKELKELMNLSIRGTEQTMKQSPLTKDNFVKIQRDRLHAEEVLFRTQVELIEGDDFQYLLKSIHSEKQTKLSLQRQIIKEEQGRQKIKQLNREIVEVKREKELETQHCNELIAHLKDQLQEMKAKINMEAKYVKKNAENLVSQNQRRCEISEEKRREELDVTKRKIDSEERSHQEITNYLKKHQQILEEKVEYWMEKYDVDTEAKQLELNTLKTAKANDLERLHELLRKYAEYEKMVVHDRIEKERKRRKEEQDRLELQSAVMLQSWWRATLVVKKIGPYAKKKGKKKGGGGKKGGKKKK